MPETIYVKEEQTSEYVKFNFARIAVIQKRV